MKTVSYWAYRHVKSAWLLIACIKILLAALAYYTGVLLYKMEIILPPGIIYPTAMLILLVVIAVYPDRKKSTLSKKLFYARQKACDFMLPCCCCLVMITMVNNGHLVTGYRDVYGVDIVKNKTAAEILTSGKTRDQLNRKEKKILKKEFYKQLKIYAVAKITGDEATSGKAVKVILAIVAMVGLLYLLAALACNLSCSGSETAAALVAIIGITGVIFGFVLVMKRIHRGPKKINSE